MAQNRYKRVGAALSGVLILGMLVPQLTRALAAPMPTPDASPSLTVPANVVAVDTGIDLGLGDLVFAPALGRATYGTEGAGPCAGTPSTDPAGIRYLNDIRCGDPKPDSSAPDPSSPIGALVARIGTGPWFAASSLAGRPVSSAGRLMLAYNDSDVSNNTGSYHVTVHRIVDVAANAESVSTGVHVSIGEVVNFFASGSATYGTEGAPCLGRPVTDPNGNRTLYSAPAGYASTFTSVPSGIGSVETPSVAGPIPCGTKADLSAPMPSAPVGALIGRVGEGAWFQIGSHSLVTSDEAGLLTLRYNDSVPGDNTGSYRVVIYTGNFEGNSTPPASPTVTAELSGGSITGRWSHLLPSGNDWISLHTAGAPDVSYLGFTTITGASGATTLLTPTVTSPAAYELRLFRNGQRVASSAPFTIAPPVVAPRPTCERLTMRLVNPNGQPSSGAIPADGTSTIQSVVTVRDCTGQPVRDEPITFTATLPFQNADGQIQRSPETPILTGSDGTASWMFASTAKVGGVQIHAMAEAGDSHGHFVADSYLLQNPTACQSLNVIFKDPETGAQLPSTVPADPNSVIGAVGQIVDCNHQTVEGNLTFRLSVPGGGAPQTVGPIATSGGAAFITFHPNAVTGTMTVSVETSIVDQTTGLPFSADGSIYGVLPPPPPSAADQAPSRTRYVALGDSFSSGEAAVSGTGQDLSNSFFPGTWQDKNATNCHRSKYAYSVEIARQLGEPNPFRPDANYDFRACSGAVLRNLITRPQYGPQSDDPEGKNQQYTGEDLQIDHIHGDERLVTVSIGGNDLGFAGILTYCNKAKNCQNALDGTYRQHEAMVDNDIKALYPRLFSFYKLLRERSNNAPVFVMGYPTIVSSTPNDSFIEGFDQGEIDYMLPRFKVFKNMMAKAAADAGVHFVDPDPFIGNHRYGDSDSYFAPFYIQDELSDAAGKGKFAFHPTRQGQAKMAEAMIAAGAADPEHNPNPEPARTTPDPGYQTPDHWWAFDQDNLTNVYFCAARPGCELEVAPVPINKSADPLSEFNYIKYGTPIPKGTIVDKQDKKFCVSDTKRNETGGSASGEFNNGGLFGFGATRWWYVCGKGYDKGATPGERLTISGDPGPPKQVAQYSALGLQGRSTPNSSFTVQVHSVAQSLGTFTTDAQGDFDWAVNLPGDLPTGSHTITADALDAQGNAIHLSSPIEVFAAPANVDLGAGGVPTFGVPPVGGQPPFVRESDTPDVPGRIGTAIAASRNTFATKPKIHPASVSAAAPTKFAAAVVVARADLFPDALASVPLAAAKTAPVLLTGTDALDPATRTEIDRVMGGSGTVYLVGGSAALAPGVVSSLTSGGYNVVRYSGDDRFQTAVAIARAVGPPSAVFEVDGRNFPDALAAGPAAVAANGVILLSEARSAHPTTQAYLASLGAVTRFALGGNAAAADPSATALVGADRYETAALVARKFFPSPVAYGLATGSDFPDGLVGGADMVNYGGPILLVPNTVPLPAADGTYLGSIPTGAQGHVYGGTAAIGDAVGTEAARLNTR